MTPRDRAWATALTLGRNRTGFAVKDVREVALETFDEDAPSRGTIHNTVNAMAEVGILERIGEKGESAHYILS